jgi:putative transposase
MEATFTYYIHNSSVYPELLFRQNDDYTLFQTKIEKYLAPIGQLHALKLNPTEFHLIIEFNNLQVLKSLTKQPLQSTKFLSRKMADLFNSYAQSYNKKHHRKGALFQKNFKRSEIVDNEHLEEVLEKFDSE